MKFKIKEKSVILLASVFIFSVSVSGQTKRLEGDWILSTLKKNGEPVSLIFHNPEDEQPGARLSLRKSFFSMTGACNGKDGKYTANSRRGFQFDSIRTQMKYCGDGSMETDKIVSDALRKVRKYRLKGRILILQDNAGTVVLIFNYSAPAR